MKEERVHLIITGRVQGVFFRASTREQAEKLNLSGWVRNLPDGSVEIQAEGDKESLARFLDWCKSGPPNALVENVETKYINPTGELGSFNIQY